MPDLKKLITLEALQAALPSWLKSSSKPSYTADEISDTNTANKFVTSTEKNTWNAKGTYSKPSGGIPKSDLSQLVQNSLDLADSALQSESDPTVPTWAKQTNKPSYTQDEVGDGTTYKRVTSTEKSTWNNKQSALTTAQMNAVNSGINSTKVSQISTNQANILYSLNTGVKNVLPIKFPDRTVYGVTLINNNDGSIRVNGTNSQSSGTILLANIQSDIYTDGYSDLSNFLGKNKDYVLVGNTTTANLRIQVLGWNSSSDNSIIASSSTDAVSFNTSTWNYIAIRLWAAASAAFSNVTITPMICTADAWAQSHDHQPPALPNSDLTRLEAEDRAALAEEIDAGAKNIIVPYDVTYPVRGMTLTYSSDGILVTGTATENPYSYLKTGTITIKAGVTYAVYDSAYTNNNTAYFYVDSSTAFDIATPSITNEARYLVAKNSGTFNIYMRAPYNVTVNKLHNPMICTKAAWKVSQKFVPYRPDLDLIYSSLQCDVKYAKVPVSTSYSLIGSIKTKGNRVCRITVTQEYAAVAPTGLILSKSNQSSDFNTLTNMIAPPVETTTDNLTLTISTLCYFTYDRVIYIWAKAKTASTNGNNFMALCEHFGDIDGVTKSMS